MIAKNKLNAVGYYGDQNEDQKYSQKLWPNLSSGGFLSIWTVFTTVHNFSSIVQMIFFLVERY